MGFSRKREITHVFKIMNGIDLVNGQNVLQMDTFVTHTSPPLRKTDRLCKFIVLFENIIIQKCKKGKEEIGVFGGGFGQNIKIGKESAGKLFIIPSRIF